MVALDEQHLGDGLAYFIQGRRVVADLLAGYGGRGAGRHAAAVGIDRKFYLHPAVRIVGSKIPACDIDSTQLAASMGREPGTVAQMGNIDTGCQRRIHDGLPGFERDFPPVNGNGIRSG